MAAIPQFPAPSPNADADTLVGKQDTKRILGIKSDNGLARLRAKYPDFPGPIKYGTSRQAPVYFSMKGLQAFIARRAAEAQAESV